MALIANVGDKGLSTIIFNIFIVVIEILKLTVLSLPEVDWAIICFVPTASHASVYLSFYAQPEQGGGSFTLTTSQ